MIDQRSERQTERAALILAGGDGTRLRSLTRRISGDDMPKQFCAVLGDATLLDETYRRVSLSIAPHRTITVVTRKHERFYAPMLARMPESSFAIQPQNRGTATAILYGLLRLANIAPTATVAVFPSDHYIDDDAQFMHHVDLAFGAAAKDSDLISILGVAPDAPEADYGWIEAGRAISEKPSLYAVSRFWEKPSKEQALELWQRGCYWNTFVIVAPVRALLALMMRALPDLYAAFAPFRATPCISEENTVVDRIYEQISSVDFSREVLERHSQQLALCPVRHVKWSDLGDSQRVLAVLDWAEIRPGWSA